MKSYLAPISAFILFSVLAVPAAFSAPPQELLRVTLQGDGEGGVESDPEGIDCPDDCEELYKKNSTVTLTAMADPGSSFLGWNGNGACGGSDPTCEIKLSATTEVIASFEAEATRQLLPATGETLCWPEVSDPPIPCEDTGQDGDIQAGAPLSYTDNGDGTITDNNTKLMWEKKDDCGGVHDKDNTYTFAAALDFADTLNNTCNGEGATECTADNECDAVCGFAGYQDWRVPNARELPTIVNYESMPFANRPPWTSPAFYSPCDAGCTVTQCSCTAFAPNAAQYRTSTNAPGPTSAYVVEFGLNSAGGFLLSSGKDNERGVRAVRGGLVRGGL